MTPKPESSESKATRQGAAPILPDTPNRKTTVNPTPASTAKTTKIPVVKSLLIKADGEGSRGGKVIGHTKSGKAVYAPSESATEYMRGHVNLQKKTAEGKLAEHAASHVRRAAKDYTTEEHSDAAQHHGKEALNYSNSDKVRAFHHHIAAAHKAKGEGKQTPSEEREAKAAKAAESKERSRIKKEGAREKKTVDKTSGGHEIKNTHHVRFGSYGPEIKEGPASDSIHHKFAGEHWAPIETELGHHLTPEKNIDIAAYHREKATHHAGESAKHYAAAAQERRTGNYAPDVNHYSEHLNHRNMSQNHSHAAAEHEAHARGVGAMEAVAGDAEKEGNHAAAQTLRAKVKDIRANPDEHPIDKAPYYDLSKSAPNVSRIG